MDMKLFSQFSSILVLICSIILFYYLGFHYIYIQYQDTHINLLLIWCDLKVTFFSFVYINLNNYYIYKLMDCLFCYILFIEKLIVVLQLGMNHYRMFMRIIYVTYYYPLISKLAHIMIFSVIHSPQTPNPIILLCYHY